MSPAGTFALDLRLNAIAIPAPALMASAKARLEFAGLPDGARIVSCHGFDTRAQRGLGAPIEIAGPRQVTVRWPATEMVCCARIPPWRAPACPWLENPVETFGASETSWR